MYEVFGRLYSAFYCSTSAPSTGYSMSSVIVVSRLLKLFSINNSRDEDRNWPLRRVEGPLISSTCDRGHRFELLHKYCHHDLTAGAAVTSGSDIPPRPKPRSGDLVFTSLDHIRLGKRPYSWHQCDRVFGYLTRSVCIFCPSTVRFIRTQQRASNRRRVFQDVEKSLWHRTMNVTHSRCEGHCSGESGFRHENPKPV